MIKIMDGCSSTDSTVLLIYMEHFSVFVVFPASSCFELHEAFSI